MTEKINRRDFLKLAGAGAAATAVLTGCGPAVPANARIYIQWAVHELCYNL